MFTELVKIVPVMDAAAMNRMFTNMGKRMASVTKKFGDGMKNALKFGGIVGILSAVVGKILNPLERAEELFKEITNKGDDAVTNAQEFGTTPGKLLRLQALGEAKGVDADTMRQMLGKFQGAVAAEKEKVALPGRIKEQLAAETDPVQKQILKAQLAAAEKAKAEGGTLREFVKFDDMADGFVSFMDSLQKVDPARRVVVQNEVLGERVRGKASELFNADDRNEVLKRLPSVEALTKAAEKTGKISDLNDLLTAIRNSQNFVTQSGLVTENMALGQDQSERLKNKHDNEQLKRYDANKTAAIAIQEIGAKLDTFMTDITTNVLPQLSTALTAISKFLPSVNETKEKVTGVVDPILKYTADFSQQAEDGQLQIQQDIRDIKNWLTTTWSTFQNSPVYKFFGK